MDYLAPDFFLLTLQWFKCFRKDWNRIKWIEQHKNTTIEDKKQKLPKCNHWKSLVTEYFVNRPSKVFSKYKPSIYKLKLFLAYVCEPGSWELFELVNYLVKAQSKTDKLRLERVSWFEFIWNSSVTPIISTILLGVK